MDIAEVLRCVRERLFTATVQEHVGSGQVVEIADYRYPAGELSPRRLTVGNM
jgi:hypothetical protein